jgi:hypothetical protein
MGNSQEFICKKCGTTNYGVVFECLKCGTPLETSPDNAQTMVDPPHSRFEAPTIIEPSPEQGAYIEITSGPDTGNHYALIGGITIGRSKKCDIVIDSPKVSREHAKIYQNQYLQWLLQDLDSMNGTILNNRRITRPTVLYNGDEFSISDSNFKVTIIKAYHVETPADEEDMTPEDVEKRGLDPLPERKGCLSNKALLIAFAIIVTICVCAVLYLGWNFLTEQGILHPLF